MIRLLGVAIIIALILNTLALAGLIGWLGFSGRLDRDRVDQVVSLFEMTIEDQAAAEAAQLAEAEEILKKTQEAARLEAASRGPHSFAQRLNEEGVASEVAVARLERLNREKADLHRLLQLDKQMIEQQRSALKKEREAFAEDIKQQAASSKDEDFQRTVQMLTKLKPKQSKEIFLRMLDAGELDQAVDYLNAMPTRVSGKILSEFKTAPEISQMKVLLDRMATRGSGPVSVNDQLAEVKS
ncbi:hypothetical protein [Poriferisphaera sp. WC338]|uniref:hypothetical protein n=1 Tax=Poriferisphaera sp. WC338 TaxID=3425129 RepID=UPI003D8141FE